MRVLREGAKAVARWIALVLVLPVLLSYWVEALLAGRGRSLEDHTEMLGLVPGFAGRYLRRAFLACVLEECHPTAFIGFGAIFSKPGARVGPGTYIGPRCHIGLATIEADALLGAGVHVLSGARTHGTGDSSVPYREQEGMPQRVRIGAGAWIGSTAVIMSDVGARTVVGAGAVVTKPLPDEAVAAGVPAKVIRRREGGEA
ncbi:MAG: acyltransferase [Gemmataceae bacterium]|nr:acyltransferase [Gemmataceae bacterium]